MIQTYMNEEIFEKLEIGDALLQKTYTPDRLGAHSKENRGEEIQFYVAQTHEAIIEKSAFEAAQKLLQSQRIEQSEYHEYYFSRKIRCAECGHYYRRKQWNDIVYWICTTHALSERRTSFNPYIAVIAWNHNATASDSCGYFLSF